MTEREAAIAADRLSICFTFQRSTPQPASSFSQAGCSQDDQMDGDESQVCRKGCGMSGRAGLRV